VNDQTFRKRLAIESYYWFFHIYFSHYIKYPTADFQREWCQLLQDESIKFLEIIGFRGSAKTTYSMLGFPIWATIANKSHFSVLVSDTFSQIKSHIYNIKTELENNSLLIKDFGPFEENEEWTATSIVLPKYNTKIVGKSTGQKIRGMRYKQWRPSLILLDDIEDLEMIRTKEQRDKTYRWFTGNVIPAGTKDTSFVLIGNLLHSDAIMSRIKKEIENGNREGKVVEYPLLKNGEITWKGKYPDREMIEKEKRKVGQTPIGMRAWQREYLLRLIPEEGQIIKDNWIRYYDVLPNLPGYTATGVDLAISKKESADYTAMVSGKLITQDGKTNLYILPNPVNERLSGLETTRRGREISLQLGNGNSLTPLWVEDVAYQKMQIETMADAGLPVEGVKVSKDKRARLMAVSSYIQNGTVLFSRKGCEDLIGQLLGFGIEAHDDLVDAFTILVSKMMLGKVAGHFGEGDEEKSNTVLGNVMNKEF